MLEVARVGEVVSEGGYLFAVLQELRMRSRAVRMKPSSSSTLENSSQSREPPSQGLPNGDILHGAGLGTSIINFV